MSGGVYFTKNQISAVISLAAYVSVNALSTIESSSGVNPPNIILKRPTRLIILLLRISAGLSSGPGIGKSKRIKMII